MDSEALNLNPKVLERLAKYIENKLAQEYGVFLEL